MSQPAGYPLVLVVESDPLLMMSLVGFVEDAGFEALEADTIDEALRILEARTDIRTVFTDLDTRDATAGLKMALAIRDRWPPIELLMISSLPWAERELPTRGVLLGKPFDRRGIVAALRRMVT